MTQERAPETEAYRRGAAGALAAVAMTAGDGHAAQIETLVAMVARLSEQSYEYRVALRPFAKAARAADRLGYHALSIVGPDVEIGPEDFARVADLVPEEKP